MGFAIFTGEDTELPDYRGVPAMISEIEAKLYRSTARTYTGAGSVVEVGPWLGASTRSLCTGLNESGRDWSLTCIDSFRWNAGYSQKSGIALEVGDSFLSIFEQNVAPYRSRIATVPSYISDLRAEQFPKTIELLFIDAPKSWKTMAQLYALVASRLIPGRSTLLFQDFLHFTSYELIWFFLLIPGLKLSHLSSEGSTGVFSVTDQLDPKQHDPQALHPRHLPVARLQQLWQEFLGELPEQKRNDVDGSFVLLLNDLGFEAEARTYAKRTVWSARDLKRIRSVHDRLSISEPKKARKYGVLLEELEAALKRPPGTST
jgi:predicted O-methyltransferase YrrM